MVTGYITIYLIMTILYFTCAWNLRVPRERMYTAFKVAPGNTKELMKRMHDSLFRGFIIMLVGAMCVFTIIMAIIGGI